MFESVGKKNILQQPEATTRNLRVFGIGLAVLFSIYSSYKFLLSPNNNTLPIIISGGLAVIFAILGWRYHAALKPIYAGWMYIAVRLGHVLSLIILAILFFCVITPLGLIRKLFSADFLELRINNNATTYWKPHKQVLDKKAYLREF